MNHLQDFMGNQINPNDLVAFSSFSTSELTAGVVIKCTPKMVKILPKRGAAFQSWNKENQEPVLRSPQYVVVVGNNQHLPDKYVE